MQCGRGVTRRHDGIRDALTEWLESIDRIPLKEQEVPRWNTASERARLDIVLTDPKLGEVCVDVSVATTVRRGVGKGAVRGLERREKRNHMRYPGIGLYPFVLDVRGRWGRETHAFVQTMAGALPK